MHKKKIFGILKGKFHEQLETPIDILEQHFAKKEPNLEIDKNEKSDLKKILCNMKSRWKESYSKEKVSHPNLWQCFCAVTVLWWMTTMRVTWMIFRISRNCILVLYCSKQLIFPKYTPNIAELYALLIYYNQKPWKLSFLRWNILWATSIPDSFKIWIKIAKSQVGVSHFVSAILNFLFLNANSVLATPKT